MILRLLLWVILFYIIIKVVRIVSFYSATRRSKYERGQGTVPPFSNIEEAKFEDITPDEDEPGKPPTAPPSPTEK